MNRFRGSAWRDGWIISVCVLPVEISGIRRRAEDEDRVPRVVPDFGRVSINEISGSVEFNLDVGLGRNTESGEDVP